MQFNFQLVGRAIAPSVLPRLGAWDVSGLPSGVTFNSTTGLISGTPTTPGTSSVAVTLYDNDQITATQVIPVTIADKNVTTLTLPSALGGVSVQISPTPISLTGAGTDTLGIPVTYGSDSPSICFVDSNDNLIMLAAGPCLVTATSGTGTMLSKAVRTVVITKANQLVTVANEVVDGYVNITDDPLGVPLNASSSSGLEPVYNVVLPVTGEPNCDIDSFGKVTWTADLVTAPVPAANYLCDIEVSQPGNPGFYAAPTQTVRLKARHVDIPIDPNAVFTQTEPTVSMSMPRSGGNASKGGVTFAIAIDKKKKLFTVKPMSAGYFIGPIQANITIEYKKNDVVTYQSCTTTFGIAALDAKKQIITDKTKETAAAVAAVTKPYLAMKQKGLVRGPKGYLSAKTFTNSVACTLNKDAYAYFDSGQPIKATALVIRDARFPTTYQRKRPNGSPIPTNRLPWSLTIG